ncbi:hypothetical protein [Salinarimonas sp.]|uniref:hypothetical protein n=1 Tax=Salinarimonas sp. TaxID=2766526 RepID=UPI0032D8E311
MTLALMSLVPLLSLALIAGALVALRGATGAARALLIAGFALFVVAWAPLLVGMALDPDGSVIGNALGLGLLAWGGSALALAVLLAGLVTRWARG